MSIPAFSSAHFHLVPTERATGSWSMGDGHSDPDHNVVIASEDQRSRNVPEFHYAIDERERLRLRP